MKDFSMLSDFEINKRVAQLHGGFALTLAVHDEPLSGKAFEPGRFDPCNNISDAWPIMLENKISLMWQTAEKDWCAWANGDLEEGCWDWKYCPDDYYVHASPLRAAMIVFLKMQEGK